MEQQSLGAHSAAARPPLPLAALCLALALLAALLLTDFLLYRRNTLYENDRWMSTKPLLGKGVLGAVAYVTTRTALSGNRLDLGAWHGFNEVLSTREMPLVEAEFDFRLEDRAFLIFEYDRRDAGCSGLRLSRSEHFDQALATIAQDGAFVEKRSLPQVALNDGWNHLRVVFAQDGTSFFLNGDDLARDPRPPLRQQRVGFRGSKDPTLVDDVTLTAPGEVVVENFRNTRGFGKTFLVVALCLLALTLVVGLAVRIATRNARHALFACLLLDIVIACLGATAYALDFFWLSRRYRSSRSQPTGLVERPNAPVLENTIEGKGQVTERIKRRLAAEGRGKDRILFIGSSQTWGAGAAREEDTFVSRLEAMLDRDQPGRYQCLNLGFSAAVAPSLWESYAETWSRLRPKLVVINLSHNDDDPAEFEKSLESFVQFNRERNIRTIFVLEANFIDAASDNLPANHAIMREVAARASVPIIDMHAYLSEHADDGLLWWDLVHLSSFGHKLVADELYRELRESLP